MNYTIKPYKTDIHGWTFIDPTTKRSEAENALVAGMDVMLDRIYSATGSKYFALTFSDVSIDDKACYMQLEWIGGDKCNNLNIGNFYRDVGSGLNGWLCPVLFDYFKEEAPDNLYFYVDSI